MSAGLSCQLCLSQPCNGRAHFEDAELSVERQKRELALLLENPPERAIEPRVIALFNDVYKIHDAEDTADKDFIS